MNRNLDMRSRVRGILFGTAAGDAVGLPVEGLNRRRNNRIVKGKWRHRFIFGKGMISDDTEHTIFVAQSLLAHSDSPENFASRLASCFRWWLVSLPAGIGFATLRSIMKLWIGFKPRRSGVFSAGNGPAMRSAPIGAFFADNPVMRLEYVKVSTRITHTDPRAMTGAMAVADITAWVIRDQLTERPPPDRFLKLLMDIDPTDEEWQGVCSLMETAIREDLSVSGFADLAGQQNGISGYIYRTVPVVCYAWYLHFGNFRKTLESILNCGGDTDTAGAIAGAMAGAVSGEKGIPGDWINDIVDWPRGIDLLKQIADSLEEKIKGNYVARPAKYFLPGVVLRNLFFLMVVLIHGMRRLFPPY